MIIAKKIFETPVIILLGGKGSRFSDLNEKPKQLVKINKHNLLMNIILKYNLYKKNFFILPLGHKANYFKKYLYSVKKKYKLNILEPKNMEQFSKKKINILIFDAGKKTSKIQRIKKSIKFFISSYFFFTYGDGIGDINFDKSEKYFRFTNKFILTSFKVNSRYGHIKSAKKKIITNFFEKPKLQDPINIGFYIFNTKLFLKYSNGMNELEKDFLPFVAKKKLIRNYPHEGFFFNIDSKNDLFEVKNKKKYLLNKL